MATIVFWVWASSGFISIAMMAWLDSEEAIESSECAGQDTIQQKKLTNKGKTNE